MRLSPNYHGLLGSTVSRLCKPFGSFLNAPEVSHNVTNQVSTGPHQRLSKRQRGFVTRGSTPLSPSLCRRQRSIDRRHAESRYRNMAGIRRCVFGRTTSRRRVECSEETRHPVDMRYPIRATLRLARQPGLFRWRTRRRPWKRDRTSCHQIAAQREVHASLSESSPCFCRPTLIPGDASSGRRSFSAEL